MRAGLVAVVSAAIIASSGYIWTSYGQEKVQDAQIQELRKRQDARADEPRQLENVETRVQMIEDNQRVMLQALSGVQRSLGKIEGKLGIPDD